MIFSSHLVLLSQTIVFNRLFNEKIDVLLLPGLPTFYTRKEVRKSPKETNSSLGYYHNFCNLLDLCAIAFPSGAHVEVSKGLRKEVSMPFGVTLFAPAWQDEHLVELVKKYTSSL